MEINFIRLLNRGILLPGFELSAKCVSENGIDFVLVYTELKLFKSMIRLGSEKLK